jgi:hypothetical protein
VGSGFRSPLAMTNLVPVVFDVGEGLVRVLVRIVSLQ